MSHFDPHHVSLQRIALTLLLGLAWWGLGGSSLAFASGHSQTEWIDPWQAKPRASSAERQELASASPTLGEGALPLAHAIERYKDIEKAGGGWAYVPGGEPLTEGVRDPRVRIVRQRLLATGELNGRGDDPDLFDAGLTKAIELYQDRNGLQVDGVLNSRTLDAMNVSVRQRIRQLQGSLSRLNGVSGKLPARYVFVNIAGQEVEAVENGKVALKKRVIVGKEDRQTPEYVSKITYVTLNPYWNVPFSIATKDMLGKIRSNPGFLDRMGIRVLRNSDGAEVAARAVDWSSAGVMNRYRLRQDPSKYNSLGTVRINFPNPYSVYLHDTPVKTLFGREDRTFSSGCVRVEDVRELAAWLLKPNGGWGVAQVDAAIARGGNKDVPLAASVPIYMFYLTAWVDENGLVHFRDDAYDRTRKLSDAS